MHNLNSNSLKSILHSKRAQIYYLEHCRVLVRSGRVEFVTDEGRRSLYWNIPIANTITVILCIGTSVTQAAMRELAKAGVLVGFCGGGGTPLFSANEVDIEMAWFSPQSEYRPTEYLLYWVKFWFDDSLRLQAAKAFQRARIERVREHWNSNRMRRDEGFEMDLNALDAALAPSLQANRFLDHGNYLAYGLAASATWVLGLPHGLAVLHGKTRRGGLVFDVADLVKDAVILPQAFLSALNGDDEQAFRRACIENLTRAEALDFMIDTLKDVAMALGRKNQ